MTSINTLLGVELPIIRALMAGVEDEALAIAVSEAADSARCHAHC
jgi:NAD(P)H-dependent flavin oxidoreductase YrpB (nitropropane dioxygenase family)